MEELDALTDTEGEDQESKVKLSSSPDSLSTCEEVSGSAATTLREDTPTQGKAESSSSRGSEKKVRFSEELIQVARVKGTTSSQDSASSESRYPSSLKASSPRKYNHEAQGQQQPLESAKQDDGSPQDQGGGRSAPPVAQQQASEIECTKKDSITLTALSYTPAKKGSASIEESADQPIEVPKCNISNANTGMKLLH